MEANSVLGPARFPSMRCLLSLVVLFLVSTFLERAAGEDECLRNAANDACRDFVYMGAAQDVISICTSKPWLVGCEIRASCDLGRLSDEQYCNSFSILGDLCAFDAKSMAACSNYTKLCGSPSSAVRQCSDLHPIPSLPKSVEVRQKVVQACADGEVNLQCSSCGREEANCTTGLAALSGLCQGAAADKALCSSWKVLCAQQEHGVRLGAFCFAPPEAAEAAQGTMRSAGRGSRREQPGGTGDADSAASSCFQDPTQDTCRSFRYPDRQTEQDIHDMCETPGISMGWMTGCSIARACRDGRLSRGSKVCRPFSVLATLCADMPGMKGCSHDSGYNRICSRGSVVAQCAEEPPLPFLPRTSSTIKNIVAMCHDHSMLGCEQCTQPSGNACPRPLETLSQLCLSMPYMSWCSDFTAMCQAPQGDGRELGAFCLADTHSNYLPPMRMFFHASITDVVLFTSWIPRTGWQYVATLAAVVAMGLLSSALKALRAVAEAQWRSQSARRIVAARLRSRPRPFVSLLASAATPAAEPLGRGCDSAASREERKPPSASLRAFAWLAGAAASSSGCGCCWGPSKAVAEADGERAHDPLSLQSNGWSNSSRSNSTDAADVLERDSDERCRLRPQLSGRAVPPWPVVQPEQDTFMTASQAHQNTVRCAFTLLTTTLDYLLMLVAMTFNVGLFAAVVFGHGLGTLVFAHVPAALSCSVEAVGVPDEEWLGEPHCGAQA